MWVLLVWVEWGFPFPSVLVTDKINIFSTYYFFNNVEDLHISLHHLMMHGHLRKFILMLSLHWRPFAIIAISAFSLVFKILVISNVGRKYNLMLKFSCSYIKKLCSFMNSRVHSHSWNRRQYNVNVFWCFIYYI